VIVVISALSGVTNLLLESAVQASNEGRTFYAAEASLRQVHFAIADQLVSDLARRARSSRMSVT